MDGKNVVRSEEQKKIIRVFPRRTSMTPLDDYTFCTSPNGFIPSHDEIHVSTLFTWDREIAKCLYQAWQDQTDKPVKIGGPAFNSPANAFIPGQYVKLGVTFTSRGCPNKCSFCHVPRREGKIRELPIQPGNIIQDNNFLATTRQHQERVFEMLQSQRAISFRGGLETRRLTEWHCEQLRGLRIADLWLACDTEGALRPLKKAIGLLSKAGFSRNKIRCYVLIGDDMTENEARLREVYSLGALPFAQLYQPEEKITYSGEWRTFTRKWSRPAIYKSIMSKLQVAGGFDNESQACSSPAEATEGNQ